VSKNIICGSVIPTCPAPLAIISNGLPPPLFFIAAICCACAESALLDVCCEADEELVLLLSVVLVFVVLVDVVIVVISELADCVAKVDVIDVLVVLDVVDGIVDVEEPFIEDETADAILVVEVTVFSDVRAADDATGDWEATDVVSVVCVDVSTEVLVATVEIACADVLVTTGDDVTAGTVA